MSSSGALLILRLSALGDILHTLPAVEALRASFPSRSMAWVVEQPYRELVELIAPVDRVLTVATKRWRRGLLQRQTVREVIAAVGALRAFAREGSAVDFQGLNKSAFLGWASRASERYGFGREAIRERSATLWTNRHVAVDPSRHVVEQNLELAAAVGGSAPGPPAWSHLHRLPADPDGALAQLLDRHPIVLNAGAGHESKLWPPESFARLAAGLRQKTATLPLVLWGPSERELAETIVREGDAVLAPPTDLRELAFVLQKARLVVASDTGPLHLAAAFATPVIGLFGPTSPRRNGPYGQLERCVETYTTDRSMKSIPVDAVLRLAEEILA